MSDPADAAPLVAFGEQGEQHLHLAAVVLHVSDIVQDEALDAVEPAQLPAQAKVALGFEEAFDQGRDRGEEHRVALAYQLVTERRDHMGLARARIAEHAQVRGALQKLPFDQTRNLGAYSRDP